MPDGVELPPVIAQLLGDASQLFSVLDDVETRLEAFASQDFNANLGLNVDALAATLTESETLLEQYANLTPTATLGVDITQVIDGTAEATAIVIAFGNLHADAILGVDVAPITPGIATAETLVAQYGNVRQNADLGVDTTPVTAGIATAQTLLDQYGNSITDASLGVSTTREESGIAGARVLLDQYGSIITDSTLGTDDTPVASGIAAAQVLLDAYGNVITNASLGADDTPAIATIAATNALLDRYGDVIESATLNADASAVAPDVARAIALADTYGRVTEHATLGTDNTQEIAGLAAAQILLDQYGSVIATAHLATDSTQEQAGVAEATALLNAYSDIVAVATLGADASRVPADIAAAVALLEQYATQTSDATLGTDDTRVTSGIAAARAILAQFASTVTRAPLGVDNTEEIIGLANATTLLDAWNATSATAHADINITEATAALAEINAALAAWGTETTGPTVQLGGIDQIISELSLINAQLSAFAARDYTANLSVNASQGEAVLGMMRGLLAEYGTLSEAAQAELITTAAKARLAELEAQLAAWSDETVGPTVTLQDVDEMLAEVATIKALLASVSDQNVEVRVTGLAAAREYVDSWASAPSLKNVAVNKEGLLGSLASSDALLQAFAAQQYEIAVRPEIMESATIAQMSELQATLAAMGVVSEDVLIPPERIAAVMAQLNALTAPRDVTIGVEVAAADLAAAAAELDALETPRDVELNIGISPESLAATDAIIAATKSQIDTIDTSLLFSIPSLSPQLDELLRPRELEIDPVVNGAAAIADLTTIQTLISEVTKPTFGYLGLDVEGFTGNIARAEGLLQAFAAVQYDITVNPHLNEAMAAEQAAEMEGLFAAAGKVTIDPALIADRVAAVSATLDALVADRQAEIDVEIGQASFGEALAQLHLLDETRMAPVDAVMNQASLGEVLTDLGALTVDRKVQIDADPNLASFAVAAAETDAFIDTMKAKMDTASLFSLAPLATGLAALVGGAGAGAGGGGLGVLGGGFGGSFTGIFGTIASLFSAKFGSLLSLAGFGPEHLLTTGLGLAGSAAGAGLGGGLLGLGALGVGGVGLGTDLAGFGQAYNDVKNVSSAMNALNTATATYGANSTEAAAAQSKLNQALTSFNPVARGAVEAAAAGLGKIGAEFDAATGQAEKMGAEIISSLEGVAMDYIPTIGKFATENTSIIQNALNPLFDWLKSAGTGGGLGIFNELEEIFQSHLPAAMGAFDNGVELLIRTIGLVAPYTGKFIDDLDRLFTRLNGSGWGKYAGEVQTLIGLFQVWAGFVDELIKDIAALFHDSAGLGAGIIGELTTYLKELHNAIQSATGKDDLERLFNAHKAEILALIALAVDLGRAFISAYMLIAPALTEVVTLLLRIADAIVKVIDAIGPLRYIAGFAVLIATTQILTTSMETLLASFVEFFGFDAFGSWLRGLDLSIGGAIASFRTLGATIAADQIEAAGGADALLAKGVAAGAAGGAEDSLLVPGGVLGGAGLAGATGAETAVGAAVSDAAPEVGSLIGVLGGLAIAAAPVAGVLAAGIGAFALIKASTDAWNGSVQKLIGNVEQLPTKTLPELHTALDATNAKIKTLSDSMKLTDTTQATVTHGIRTYVETTTQAGDAVNILRGHAKELSENIKTQNANFAELNTKLGLSKSQVDALNQSLGINLNKALDPAQINKFGAALLQQTKAAGTTEKALEGLATTSGQTTAEISAAAENAMQTTTQAWQSFGNAITNFAGTTVPAGSTIAAFYNSQLAQATTFNANIQKAIGEGYSAQLIASIEQAGPAESGFLQGLVSANGQGLQSLITQTTNALSKEQTQAVQAARLTQEAISASSSQMTAQLSNALAISQALTTSNVAKSLQGLINSMSGGLTQFKQIIKEYGISVPSNILAQLTPTAADASSLAQALNAAGLKGGAAYADALKKSQEAGGDAKKAHEASKDVIKKAHDGMKSVDASDAGKKLVDTAVKGIVSQQSKLSNAAKKAIKDAIDQGTKISASGTVDTSAINNMAQFLNDLNQLTGNLNTAINSAANINSDKIHQLSAGLIMLSDYAPYIESAIVNIQNVFVTCSALLPGALQSVDDVFAGIKELFVVVQSSSTAAPSTAELAKVAKSLTLIALASEVAIGPALISIQNTFFTNSAILPNALKAVDALFAGIGKLFTAVDQGSKAAPSTATLATIAKSLISIAQYGAIAIEPAVIVIRNVFEKGHAVLPGALKAVDTLFNDIKKLFAAVNGADRGAVSIAAIANVAKSLISVAQYGAIAIEPAVLAIQKIFAKGSTTVPAAVKAVTGLFDKITTLFSAIRGADRAAVSTTAIAGVAKSLISIAQYDAIAIEPAILAIRTVFEHSSANLPAALKAVSGLFDKVATLFDAVGTANRAVKSSSGLSAVAHALNVVALYVGLGIGPAIVVLHKALTDSSVNIPKTITAVDHLFADITTLFDHVSRTANAKFNPAALNTITGEVQKLSTSLSGLLPTVSVTTIASSLTSSDTLGSINTTALGQAIVTSTAKGITSSESKLTQSLDNAIKNAVNGTTGVSGLQTIGHTIDTQIAQGITAGNAVIHTAIVNMIHTMTTSFATIATTLHTVGQAIDLGLVIGINSGRGAVDTAVANVVKSAITSAKSAAGVSSPSTIFHTIGMNLMQGLAKGITDNIGLVHTALSTVSHNLTATPLTVGVQSHITAGTVAPIGATGSNRTATSGDIQTLASELQSAINEATGVLKVLAAKPSSSSTQMTIEQVVVQSNSPQQLQATLAQQARTSAISGNTFNGTNLGTGA